MENINEILTLDSNAQIKNCKRGEILQHQGAITSMAYFVKKGLLRSYIIDEKGKEHIYMFASEGWIIADLESQEFNHPAALFIDCLEDSEVLIFDSKCFSVADLSDQQLRKNIALLTRRIAVLQRRVMNLMSATAEYRYQTFLETYPDLPNRVPQRMIASYLGIMPQTLSTIRSKIAKGK